MTQVVLGIFLWEGSDIKALTYVINKLPWKKSQNLKGYSLKIINIKTFWFKVYAEFNALS